MKDIMVDLETLGTVADAVIMSIGAVKFDLGSQEIDDGGFYASVSIDSNLELRRRVQEDTLIWWMKQSPDAQKVFYEPKQTLEDSLIELSDWVGTKKYTIWSNGADFDIPMLAHAYTQCGVEVPWEFWNSRCFRTFKNLPAAKAVKAEPMGIKHNAMSDAINQARHAQNIQAALFSSKTKARV